MSPETPPLALAEGNAAVLRELRFDLAEIDELAGLHRRLWDLEDLARSRVASAETIRDTKRAIDEENAARHVCIDRFDASGRLPVMRSGAVPFSETFGELCDRLLIVALKVERTVALARDEGLSADERARCARSLAGLLAWQRHLQGCLRHQGEAAQAGLALLPPRAEHKLYNQKRLNPITRDEAG